MDNKMGSRSIKGKLEITPALMIREVIIVIKLMAKLMGTASSACRLRTPINTGNRNSAPPKPINPPRIPIGIEIKNATSLLELDANL